MSNNTELELSEDQAAVLVKQSDAVELSLGDLDLVGGGDVIAVFY